MLKFLDRHVFQIVNHFHQFHLNPVPLDTNRKLRAGWTDFFRDRSFNNIIRCI
jgi:hypothetical protein